MNITKTAVREQSAALLPTYSADTFGVCSALFELGGMIVIHDPSGCNSTYTTHDEPRWYDHDSLIFISAMTEYDAILGRDDKLLRDIEDAAQASHPNFICVIPSQIAHLIATDLSALCRILERDTSIPAFTLPTNSMHPYDLGIQYALTHLARHVAKKTTPTKKAPANRPRVNLLGLTPLDFHYQKSLASLKAFLASHGLDLAASWTLDTSLEEIATSTTADVNLVLTQSALPAAKILEEQCGIPYLPAIPYPPLESTLANAIESACHKNKVDGQDASTDCYFEPAGCFPWKFLNPKDRLFPREIPRQPATTKKLREQSPKNYIIGEPLSSTFLAAALHTSTNASFDVLTPPFSEPDLIATLKAANLVLADPLYEALTPPTAHFIKHPHRACSGRTYEKQERNLLDPVEWAALLSEMKPYL
ncbi:MAG: nitrogenase component 1 [Selenomonas sp.]|uniref:nitrogenase component 1 n=1 Tax=Selenomonas sp. TaxID=2053611 RepID=UPI0025FF488D|nr:nitrogenase component 1 [Selenomonas sp.]MCI6084640.1 nitrogenase component 1 [Selenomonas sp.]